MTIISQFLRRKELKVDHGALTHLSERTREDTCQTLRELCHRLLRRSPPRKLNGHSNSIGANEENTHKKGLRRSASERRVKVRRKMLAQVVIADSSKPAQIAIVKPGEKKKTRSQAHASSDSASSLGRSKTFEGLPSAQLEAPKQEHQRAGTMADEELPRRRQITAEMHVGRPPLKPNVLRATHSRPQLEAARSKPEETIASPQYNTSTPVPDVHSRKPTPTYYSIASNSTKLGEIPLHKWREAFDFDAASLLDKEVLQNGWPISGDPIEQERKKRKGLGFFRLFRTKKAAGTSGGH